MECVCVYFKKRFVFIHPTRKTVDPVFEVVAVFEAGSRAAYCGSVNVPPVHNTIRMPPYRTIETTTKTNHRIILL